MAQTLELELKLEFEPGDRRRLEAAIAPKAAGRARHLVTTYFDTPGKDLVKAGYTLRIRQSGKQYVQAVKAVGRVSAGLFKRSEWEQPLADAQPQLDESGPIVQAVVARKLTQIQPVFVTDVRRRTFRISGPDSDIEVAVDSGQIRAADFGEPLNEIEFELRGGSIGPLFDLARQLNEQVPLRLAVRSKSERGYSLKAKTKSQALKAEPVSLDRDGDAYDTFCAIAQACIRHFRLNEAVLSQSGDAEALHQARVALRRLRSAFSIFKSLLGDGGTMLLLSAELRWLTTELGEVRNIDVLMGYVDGEARDQLSEVRARTFSHVHAELTSGRTRLLMIDLVEWLAVGTWRTAPAHPGRAHGNARHFARARLEVLRHRLNHNGQGLAALDDKQRHRVRIEAKKLRYAAEFFASLYVTDKERRRHRRFIEALEKLQEVLGALNDLAVGQSLAAQHGIDLAPMKVSMRLRAKAEGAYDALMRNKRFW